MKKIALKMIVVSLFIAIAFSGCAKEIKYIKPKIPKLKSCIVKRAKVSYKIKNGLICLKRKDYRVLKKQNYRLRVCLDLLNRQIKDFNKRYVK